MMPNSIDFPFYVGHELALTSQHQQRHRGFRSIDTCVAVGGC